MRVNTAEFSRLLGTIGIEASTATVSRYENDERTITLEYFKGVAELSGAALDYLVLGRSDAAREAAILDRAIAVLTDMRRAVAEQPLSEEATKRGAALAAEAAARAGPQPQAEPHQRQRSSKLNHG